MSTQSTKTVLVIIGMRDNSCRERLCAALLKLAGVVDVDISLVRARGIVVHCPPCHPAGLVWAVVSAGYGAALDESHGDGLDASG